MLLCARRRLDGGAAAGLDVAAPRRPRGGGGEGGGGPAGSAQGHGPGGGGGRPGHGAHLRGALASGSSVALREGGRRAACSEVCGLRVPRHVRRCAGRVSCGWCRTRRPWSSQRWSCAAGVWGERDASVACCWGAQPCAHGTSSALLSCYARMKAVVLRAVGKHGDGCADLGDGGARASPDAHALAFAWSTAASAPESKASIHTHP